MRLLNSYALLFLFAACQTPMQSGSQCLLEPGSLDAANTYAWHFEQALDVVDDTGFVAPMMVDQLQRAVVDEMTNKGFQLVDGNADVTLSMVLRTRRELVSYNSSPSPCETNDCWERVSTGTNVRMDIRTVGFLAADIYVDGQAIWRGWVETDLYPKDRDAAGEVIARAIPKLLESFPP